VAQFDHYDPLADIGKLEMWGFDYCEPAVAKVMGLSEGEFQMILKKTLAGRIHVEAMNSFIPADLKVVGSQVDRPRLRDYLKKALARAEALGAKVIVFGSGDARTVPGGFSKRRAWVQLQEFLRMAGDEMSRNQYGIRLAAGRSPALSPGTPPSLRSSPTFARSARKVMVAGRQLRWARRASSA
jgi:sugar phosphate isomerase/epimerase